MHKTLKKELSFSLDTLERYRAKYGRSASLDAYSISQHTEQLASAAASTVATAAAVTPAAVQPLAAAAPAAPSSFTKQGTPPKMTKLQELQQKKEAYLRARELEKELTECAKKTAANAHDTALASKSASSSSSSTTTTTNTTSTTTTTTTTTATTTNGKLNAQKSSSPQLASSHVTHSGKSGSGCYTNWSNNHTTLASQPWCAISDLMYFCDKYEFKTLSTRDLKTHQEIVAEVRALLNNKAPFDQRTRFPGNIYDPENLWVCIGRCASVEYHMQRIISIFRKPLASMTPDKQRAVRQNFHLAVSELRLDISARISEVRLYDRLVFEREFRLEWQDEA